MDLRYLKIIAEEARNHNTLEGRPFDSTVCYLSVSDMAKLCNRNKTSILKYIKKGLLRVTYKPTKKNKSGKYFIHPEDARAFSDKLKKPLQG